MTREGIDPGVVAMSKMRAATESMSLPSSLGSFVAERARALGDQPACVYFEDGAILSYRDIDQQADRLAASFLTLGIRKGTHVAVMLPNGPVFPPTWTALARIGAVMVPVNTGYTGTELSYVLNDSDAAFLVIDALYLSVFEEMPDRPELLADGNVIVAGPTEEGGFRDWQDLCEGGGPFRPPQPVGEGDLLNIQYTSGTTGFPKGCLLSHRYWMQLSHGASLMADDASIRNVLIWAPFFYMDPMWQMLLAFRQGGTAFVAKRMSLTRFLDWVRDHDIHYCAFPEPLLQKLSSGTGAIETPLKFVNAFGWRPEAIREVEERFGLIARDAFGMTEIGLGSVMPKAATGPNTFGSCGLPGPFREMRVFDEAGLEVPNGEAGELCVRGPGMLWGYYKRPEANRETFRGDWFRTGDLATQDENGYIRIVGRLKEMIKRAGENIAAREVEAVLREMPEIQEAAVVAVPDTLRREEVKAYVLLADGIDPENLPPSKIVDHCSQRLAAFKLPRYVAYVSEFPRTATRKVAKQKLVTGAEDLRVGAYDRVEDVWR